MTREWHTFGICSPEPYKLKAQYRKKLLDIVGQDRPEAEAFLAAISEGIGSAVGVKSQREKVKPAAVRKNLKNSAKALSKVIESFNQLDDLSKSLLREVPEGSNFPEMMKKICDYYKNVSKALKQADEFQKKGNLYQGHYRFLAYHVAAAINDILKLTPTLTHSESDYIRSPNIGIYSRCLSITLEVVGFCNDKDINPENLYNLMKQGLETLNSRVIHPDGLIEFRTGSI